MPDRSTVVLRIRVTKTIQFGQRVLILPFTECPGSVLCPVRAYRGLLLVAPADKNLPLFSCRVKGRVQMWTHSSFVGKLRAILSSAGYDSRKYSGHSLRRGGATLGFRLGMSLVQIKQRGDWASNAVENYVYISDIQIRHTATVLSKGAQRVLDGYIL